MNELVIILCIIFIVLLLALSIVWRRTDWEKLDRHNERFIDENGDHAYYDKDKHRKR